MMALHRLLAMRVGVPAPDALAAFYREVGLDDAGGGRLATTDGGPNVIIEEAPYRRLLGVELGVDDDRDLHAIAGHLGGLGLRATVTTTQLTVTDPTTHVSFTVRPADHINQKPPAERERENAPGAVARRNRRAPAVFEEPRPPRRLGHIVIGTPDIAATRAFLVGGLGLKISDELEGVISFLRCSTDHHNVALVRSPVPILQHHSWQCDSSDHVGHTATKLLRADAGRHTWGFGRHFVGSNHYWYLRDPSGSFLELYSDMDVIDDDEAWERDGRTPLGLQHATNAWGPNIPLEFIAPPDLEELQRQWAMAER